MTQIVYGYTFDTDIDTQSLYDLNGMMQEPFRIFCLDSGDVIGFIPPVNLLEAHRLSQELAVYVIDNLILDGIEIDTVAAFYSGVDAIDIDDASVMSDNTSITSRTSVTSHTTDSRSTTQDIFETVSELMEELDIDQL